MNSFFVLDKVKCSDFFILGVKFLLCMRWILNLFNGFWFIIFVVVEVVVDGVIGGIEFGVVGVKGYWKCGFDILLGCINVGDDILFLIELFDFFRLVVEDVILCNDFDFISCFSVEVNLNLLLDVDEEDEVVESGVW